MSVNNKIIFSYEKKKIKPLKLNYNQITPKRVNLCKKYFYMDQPKDKINLIKFNNEKNALEQVDNIITKLTRKRTDLDITKIDCIKSMILSNKNIPEKWIMRPGYKDLLNIAMKDDIVLNYAINCKDIYKKKAGYDKDDDTRYEEYMKSLPPVKKFISYINPHTQNYKDSNKKKNLMKEYDKKYFKKFYKFPIIKNNSYGRYDSKNSDENRRRNKLISINKTYNLTEGNNTKNDLMVTSLHYTGLDEDKINDENKKKLELKLPEINLI